MRRIIRPISMKRAYRRGLIDNYDFCKCFVCGSSDLTQDNNQTVYHEEICGTPTVVECGVVCKNCHAYQGYVAYGSVMPVYVKEARRI